MSSKAWQAQSQSYTHHPTKFTFSHPKPYRNYVNPTTAQNPSQIQFRARNQSSNTLSPENDVHLTTYNPKTSLPPPPPLSIQQSLSTGLLTTQYEVWDTYHLYQSRLYTYIHCVALNTGNTQLLRIPRYPQSFFDLQIDRVDEQVILGLKRVRADDKDSTSMMRDNQSLDPTLPTLKFIGMAHSLLGFVRFELGYYLHYTTKVERIAEVGTSGILTVKEVALLQLFAEDSFFDVGLSTTTDLLIGDEVYHYTLENIQHAQRCTSIDGGYRSSSVTTGSQPNGSPRPGVVDDSSPHLLSSLVSQFPPSPLTTREEAMVAQKLREHKISVCADIHQQLLSLLSTNAASNASDKIGRRSGSFLASPLSQHLSGPSESSLHRLSSVSSDDDLDNSSNTSGIHQKDVDPSMQRSSATDRDITSGEDPINPRISETYAYSSSSDDIDAYFPSLYSITLQPYAFARDFYAQRPHLAQRFNPKQQFVNFLFSSPEQASPMSQFAQLSSSPSSLLQSPLSPLSPTHYHQLPQSASGGSQGNDHHYGGPLPTSTSSTLFPFSTTQTAADQKRTTFGTPTSSFTSPLASPSSPLTMSVRSNIDLWCHPSNTLITQREAKWKQVYETQSLGSGDYYFSHTYPLTHTLQFNLSTTSNLLTIQRNIDRITQLHDDIKHMMGPSMGDGSIQPSSHSGTQPQASHMTDHDDNTSHSLSKVALVTDTHEHDHHETPPLQDRRIRGDSHDSMSDVQQVIYEAPMIPYNLHFTWNAHLLQPLLDCIAQGMFNDYSIPPRQHSTQQQQPVYQNSPTVNDDGIIPDNAGPDTNEVTSPITTTNVPSIPSTNMLYTTTHPLLRLFPALIYGFVESTMLPVTVHQATTDASDDPNSQRSNDAGGPGDKAHSRPAPSKPQGRKAIPPTPASVHTALDNMAFYPNFVLIARRSRKYAGTRYIKRGLSTSGDVANEVEIEQICSFQHQYTSYVQLRGSIPLYWTQANAQSVVAKPDIEMTNMDLSKEGSSLHWSKLISRYGPRIIVLNLVKQHERGKQRETLVGSHVQRQIEELQKMRDLNNSILHIGMDYKAFVKTSVSAVDTLSVIMLLCVYRTGVFVSNPSQESIVRQTGLYDNFSFQQVFGHQRNHHPLTYTPSKTGSNTSSDRESDVNHSEATTEISSSSISSRSRRQAMPRPLSNNLLGNTTSGSMFYDHNPAAQTITAPFQVGVVRSNCIDSLDRTNVSQFLVGRIALASQLQHLSIPNSISQASATGNTNTIITLTPSTLTITTLLSIFERMGDCLALQYGGSQMHRQMRKESGKSHTMTPVLYRQTQQLQQQQANSSFISAFGGQAGKELIISLFRHYQNAFNDKTKQDVMNVFLGLYKSVGNCYIPAHSQAASASKYFDIPVAGGAHLTNTMAIPYTSSSGTIMNHSQSGQQPQQQHQQQQQQQPLHSMIEAFPLSSTLDDTPFLNRTIYVKETSASSHQSDGPLPGGGIGASSRASSDSNTTSGETPQLSLLAHFVPPGQRDEHDGHGDDHDAAPSIQGFQLHSGSGQHPALLSTQQQTPSTSTTALTGPPGLSPSTYSSDRLTGTFTSPLHAGAHQPNAIIMTEQQSYLFSNRLLLLTIIRFILQRRRYEAMVQPQPQRPPLQSTPNTPTKMVENNPPIPSSPLWFRYTPLGQLLNYPAPGSFDGDDDHQSQHQFLQMSNPLKTTNTINLIPPSPFACYPSVGCRCPNITPPFIESASTHSQSFIPLHNPISQQYTLAKNLHMSNVFPTTAATDYDWFAHNHLPSAHQGRQHTKHLQFQRMHAHPSHYELSAASASDSPHGHDDMNPTLPIAHRRNWYRDSLILFELRHPAGAYLPQLIDSVNRGGKVTADTLGLLSAWGDIPQEVYQRHDGAGSSSSISAPHPSSNEPSVNGIPKSDSLLNIYDSHSHHTHLSTPASAEPWVPQLFCARCCKYEPYYALLTVFGSILYHQHHVIRLLQRKKELLQMDASAGPFPIHHQDNFSTFYGANQRDIPKLLQFTSTSLHQHETLLQYLVSDLTTVERSADSSPQIHQAMRGFFKAFGDNISHTALTPSTRTMVPSQHHPLHTLMTRYAVDSILSTLVCQKEMTPQPSPTSLIAIFYPKTQLVSSSSTYSHLRDIIGTVRSDDTVDHAGDASRAQLHHRGNILPFTLHNAATSPHQHHQLGTHQQTRVEQMSTISSRPPQSRIQYGLGPQTGRPHPPPSPASRSSNTSGTSSSSVKSFPSPNSEMWTNTMLGSDYDGDKTRQNYKDPTPIPITSFTTRSPLSAILHHFARNGNRALLLLLAHIILSLKYQFDASRSPAAATTTGSQDDIPDVYIFNEYSSLHYLFHSQSRPISDSSTAKPVPRQSSKRARQKAFWTSTKFSNTNQCNAILECVGPPPLLLPSSHIHPATEMLASLSAVGLFPTLSMEPGHNTRVNSSNANRTDGTLASPSNTGSIYTSNSNYAPGASSPSDYKSTDAEDTTLVRPVLYLTEKRRQYELLQQRKEELRLKLSEAEAAAAESSRRHSEMISSTLSSPPQQQQQQGTSSNAKSTPALSSLDASRIETVPVIEFLEQKIPSKHEIEKQTQQTLLQEQQRLELKLQNEIRKKQEEQKREQQAYQQQQQILSSDDDIVNTALSLSNDLIIYFGKPLLLYHDYIHHLLPDLLISRQYITPGNESASIFGPTRSSSSGHSPLSRSYTPTSTSTASSTTSTDRMDPSSGGVFHQRSHSSSNAKRGGDSNTNVIESSPRSQSKQHSQPLSLQRSTCMGCISETECGCSCDCVILPPFYMVTRYTTCYHETFFPSLFQGDQHPFSSLLTFDENSVPYMAQRIDDKSIVLELLSIFQTYLIDVGLDDPRFCFHTSSIPDTRDKTNYFTLYGYHLDISALLAVILTILAHVQQAQAAIETDMVVALHYFTSYIPQYEFYRTYLQNMRSISSTSSLQPSPQSADHPHTRRDFAFKLETPISLMNPILVNPYHNTAPAIIPLRDTMYEHLSIYSALSEFLDTITPFHPDVADPQFETLSESDRRLLLGASALEAQLYSNNPVSKSGTTKRAASSTQSMIDSTPSLNTLSQYLFHPSTTPSASASSQASMSASTGAQSPSINHQSRTSLQRNQHVLDILDINSPLYSSSGGVFTPSPSTAIQYQKQQLLQQNELLTIRIDDGGHSIMRQTPSTVDQLHHTSNTSDINQSIDFALSHPSAALASSFIGQVNPTLLNHILSSPFTMRTPHPSDLPLSVVGLCDPAAISHDLTSATRFLPLTLNSADDKQSHEHSSFQFFVNTNARAFVTECLQQAPPTVGHAMIPTTTPTATTATSAIDSTSFLPYAPRGSFVSTITDDETHRRQQQLVFKRTTLPRIHATFMRILTIIGLDPSSSVPKPLLPSLFHLVDSNRITTPHPSAMVSPLYPAFPSLLLRFGTMISRIENVLNSNTQSVLMNEKLVYDRQIDLLFETTPRVGHLVPASRPTRKGGTGAATKDIQGLDQKTTDEWNTKHDLAAVVGSISTAYPDSDSDDEQLSDDESEHHHLTKGEKNVNTDNEADADDDDGGIQIGSNKATSLVVIDGLTPEFFNSQVELASTLVVDRPNDHDHEEQDTSSTAAVSGTRGYPSQSDIDETDSLLVGDDPSTLELPLYEKRKYRRFKPLSLLHESEDYFYVKAEVEIEVDENDDQQHVLNDTPSPRNSDHERQSFTHDSNHIDADIEGQTTTANNSDTDLDDFILPMTSTSQLTVLQSGQYQPQLQSPHENLATSPSTQHIPASIYIPVALDMGNYAQAEPSTPIEHTLMDPTLLKQIQSKYIPKHKIMASASCKDLFNDHNGTNNNVSGDSSTSDSSLLPGDAPLPHTAPRYTFKLCASNTKSYTQEIYEKKYPEDLIKIDHQPSQSTYFSQHPSQQQQRQQQQQQQYAQSTRMGPHTPSFTAHPGFSPVDSSTNDPMLNQTIQDFKQVENDYERAHRDELLGYISSLPLTVSPQTYLTLHQQQTANVPLEYQIGSTLGTLSSMAQIPPILPSGVPSSLALQEVATQFNFRDHSQSIDTAGTEALFIHSQAMSAAPITLTDNTAEYLKYFQS